MLHAIFALTLRSFFRNFNYSLITLSGLVISITAAVFIFIWVSFELSYDTQDPDADRVFVVMSNELMDDEILTYAETPSMIADFLTNEVPEVESMTRINNTHKQIRYQEITVDRIGMYADSNFFDVFRADFKEGLVSSALPDKNSIAISDELARLLFKDSRALGKVILIGRNMEFKVTSVFNKYPENNSLSYIHFIIPYHAKPDAREWQSHYVKLNQVQAKGAVEKKIDAKFKEHFGNENLKSLLFPLSDWRLHWKFENGKSSGGRIVFVVIFSMVGIFILLMACINYMNIATARATRRAREIGVRKMTGATQSALIRQFMVESLMISFFATAISVMMVYLLIPFFREFTGLPLQFSLADPVLVSGLIGIAFFSGLFAGTYPAFLLSAFKPAAVLKGNLQSAFRGAGLRRSLMIFQFVLSVVMIFGALVVHQQTDFLLKKDVGYDKHNVINLWLPSEFNGPLESFKREMANHPSVEHVAYSGASPMEVNGYTVVKWPGMPPDKPVYMYGASIDFDVVPTLGLKIIAGRNFSPAYVSDSSNFIITKQAASILGFEDPVGQRITYTMFGDREGEIIGVIDDFHNDDIHLPKAPVVFFVGRSKAELANMFIRYRQGQSDEAQDNLKTVFAKFLPDALLQYTFLDSDYEDQLYSERFIQKLSFAFTGVGIVIAALGLLGLTLFNAERRTREIGIRKVLGATVTQVMTLLTGEFLKPVMISFGVAFPIAYYLMNRYLEGFPYRISLTASSFLLVAGSMVGMILLIVCFQSYQAAVKNPVDTLKHE